jgi:hypothetical protein
MTDAWKETVGEVPPRVIVQERADKGGRLYFLWYVDGKPRQRAAKVVITIRDGKGRPQSRKKQKAIEEAREVYNSLHGIGAPRPTTGPMTLKQGKEIAFSPRGCYPMKPEEDAWTRDALRLFGEAVKLMGGESVAWQDVTPGMIRAAWRTMETKGRTWDYAAKSVGVFFTVATYLEGEFQGQHFPRPMKRWRVEVRDYWHRCGHDTERHRPPHTAEEIALLFGHLDRADPRLRLALALGAELRGGQLIRAMRSHCSLPDDGRWRVEIPGKSRRKPIPPLTLNAWERDQLRAALTDGYLSDLELAFQAGQLKDYALFPQGRLRKGKAVVERSAKPIDRGTLIEKFHDYERAAGVTPEDRRAWHGLRRGFSNYYAALIRDGKITDPRVLDQLQGWVRGSAMRERIYQDQEDEALQDDASDVRRFRPGLHPEEGADEG